MCFWLEFMQLQTFYQGFSSRPYGVSRPGGPQRTSMTFGARQSGSIMILRNRILPSTTRDWAGWDLHAGLGQMTLGSQDEAGSCLQPCQTEQDKETNTWCQVDGHYYGERMYGLVWKRETERERMAHVLM